MSRIDYLIVGAGLTGATLARVLTDAGKSCLVVDKRGVVAGNCYTEEVDGIHVHRYGPHIFHTNSHEVWQFINRFALWKQYSHRVKAFYRGQLYSFPPNLLTFHQLWGVRTPEDARRLIEAKRVPIERPANAEEQLLATVGEELCDLFFRGYTEKQWGRDTSLLPASIVRRIPLRFSADDRYYTDATWEAIPVDGYTALVEQMLAGIPVELETDYVARRAELDQRAERTIYAGPLDALYGYRFGRLAYRSLRFETRRLEVSDYQGCAQVNYPDRAVPFTRVVEHSHFLSRGLKHTIVTWETPAPYVEGVEPFYPIRDELNTQIHRAYLDLAACEDLLVAGRLGRFAYIDMDQAIASALALGGRLLEGKQ